MIIVVAGLLILGIIAVLVYFWYITIPVITLIAVSWWWSGKPQIACRGCHKKYRRKGGLTSHMEKCKIYQDLIENEKKTRAEWKRAERKRREEEWQREQQKRKQEEDFRKKQNDWKKNWREERKWKFSEEEFWRIQEDIDARKDHATKKLWDRYWATSNDSLQDKIQEKIDTIEEEFDDEQDTLWEQVWDYDWYEPSEKEKRARENYEKAKQEYKRSTGRNWHKDDWEKAWEEAFKDLLGDTVDLEECYEILGFPENAEFSQVKKRYRELALKHHPDRCQDKKEAERKFKEIAAAYEKIKESVEVNATSKA
tara:strand:+ start:16 stop:948 length:933 start_codon:yes stop_codon:yes gene_type:complete